MARFSLAPPKLRKWTRRREEAVGSFRVLDVWRVELEDGSGHARGDAFTVRCRDWCNVVAVTPDDEIVFVWQYRFGTDSLSLEIPGGVIDSGEDPAVAAERELREETGYEADRFLPLVVVEPNPAIQDNRCFTFIASGARKTHDPAFDPQEELQTVLVPAARVLELLDSGHVTHALVHSALEAYHRKRRDSDVGRL